MNIRPFEITDLAFLKEFEPPGWGDLVPRFEYFMATSFCTPIKGVIGDELVAIGTSILHQDTAWLATIIIHPKHRNKGLGKKITEALLDTIDHRQYQTIYLEATDMGYPIYLKLGFELETMYTHWKSEKLVDDPLSPLITNFTKEYTSQILGLDSIVSGEDRTGTLEPHLPQARLFVEKDQLKGFYLPSLGDGLIIADNVMAGTALMSDRFRQKPFASILIANREGLDFLEQNNFKQIRLSRRMVLGKRRRWQPGNFYNRISGQLG